MTDLQATKRFGYWFYWPSTILVRCDHCNAVNPLRIIANRTQSGPRQYVTDKSYKLRNGDDAQFVCTCGRATPKRLRVRTIPYYKFLPVFLWNDDKAQKLLLLLLGAVLTAVPLLINSQIQSQAALDRIVVERRLDHVRSFSLACQRSVAVANRIIATARIYVDSKDPAERARLLEQLQATMKDADETSASARAELAIANAFFETDLQLDITTTRLLVPIDPVADNEREGVHTKLNAAMDQVEASLSQCQTHTRTFAKSTWP